MTPHPFIAGLRRSPDYFLNNFDLVNRRALIVETSEADYRRASFLDDRMYTPSTRGAWFALDTVLAETADLTLLTPPHLIFHVSHCGSTLISRLLAELPGCFPLREPLTLVALGIEKRELPRPLARLDAATWQRLFSLCVALYSRCYRPEDRTLLKATSVAGNLAGDVLACSGESKALHIYTDFEPWLTTMLRNQTVRENGLAFAPAWLADLHALSGRTDVRLASLSQAEQITVNWLMSMLCHLRCREQYPERVRQLNFEEFLQQPAARLQELAAFFGLDAGKVEATANGPLMRSYAKRPGEPYDAAKRKQAMDETRRLHADEIRAGLMFAEKLCHDIPLLAPLGVHLGKAA